MSEIGYFGALARVLESSLSTNEKALLVALLSYWSESSPCPYPGTTNLMRRASMSRPRVLRTMAKLCGPGGVISLLSESDPRMPKLRSSQVHVYNLDRLFGAAPLTPALPVTKRYRSQNATGHKTPPVTKQHSTGNTLEPVPVTKQHPTGNTLEPEEIQEEIQKEIQEEAQRACARASASTGIVVPIGAGKRVGPGVADAKPDASTDADEGIVVLQRATRSPGARPRVAKPLLAVRLDPRKVDVPQDFQDYAAELGLAGPAYEDAVLDWRSRVQPSSSDHLANLLCRFLEQAAERQGARSRRAGTLPRHRQPDSGYDPFAYADEVVEHVTRAPPRATGGSS